MLCKLAFRNVRRSVKDFAVYFLTLALGVSLFYTFSSLDGQWAVQALNTASNGWAAGMKTIMNVLSVFVAVVLAFLILYANTYLMKRRKRELGTYFLLGLPTGKVAMILLLETFFIGLAALAVGLAVGILLSQGLDLLTMSMFQADYSQFAFVFSAGALIKTVLYFAVIFLIVMAFTWVSVSRAKLLDLMTAARKNEEMKEVPLGRSVALFLLGVVLIVGAYVILLTRGLLSIDPVWFLMLCMGTVGTYLFFKSLAGFLLRVGKAHKKFYFKGLHMFVLRQWSGRVHTSCLSMTVVCILLLLAIGVTASSVGLNDSVTQISGGVTPFDYTISNYGAAGGEYSRVDFDKALRDNGFDPESDFSHFSEVTLYYNDPAVTGQEKYNAVISLSDYTAQTGDALEPSALPCPPPKPISNTDRLLALLVAPDDMAASLKPRRQMINLDFSHDAQAMTEKLNGLLADRGGFAPGVSLTEDDRVANYLETMGSKVLVLYLGLYLGTVFLLTCGAVLALQQLSQAADDAPRYRVLSRLGASRKQRRRALLDQIGMAFLLPLALAVVHAAVGMASANQIIYSMSKGGINAVGNTFITAAFLLAVYGAYFLATYLSSRGLAAGNGRRGT